MGIRCYAAACAEGDFGVDVAEQHKVGLQRNAVDALRTIVGFIIPEMVYAMRLA